MLPVSSNVCLFLLSSSPKLLRTETASRSLNTLLLNGCPRFHMWPELLLIIDTLEGDGCPWVPRAVDNSGFKRSNLVHFVPRVTQALSPAGSSALEVSASAI